MSAAERLPSPDDDTLIPSEAALFLRVSIATVGRLARARKLPSFYVGAQLRFSRKALQTWADAQKAGNFDGTPKTEAPSISASPTRAVDTSSPRARAILEKLRRGRP